jgi:hypothetical protein
VGPGDEVSGVLDRDREAETLGVAGDRGVDPDERTRHVEERTAAVAGVDRGVGLDEVVEVDRAAGALVLDGDVAVERRDDALGDRLGERPEGASDRDPGLARLQRRRVADRRGGQVGGVDLDEGQVVVIGDLDDLGRILRAIREGDVSDWLFWTTWRFVRM